jgi:dTDP-4-dehydrorhamnose reductase
MKLLITGINGFLGRHLANYLAGKGFSVTATGRNNAKGNILNSVKFISFDLLNHQQSFEIINELQPTVIIHTAAMSKPDECEQQKELCLQTNFEATKALANAAQQVNAKFIFISTDFVLGEGDNHTEISTPNPLNFYAQSKLMAEQYIQQHLDNFCIIRPVLIYGKHIEGIRNTFIDWVQQSLQAAKQIKVVNDQFRTPTYVDDICFGIERMIALDKTGIYHLAGEQILTPYAMAVKVANHLQLDSSLIIPVDENSFPEPVKRAKRSIVNIDKAKTELGYLPLSFDDGLRKMLVK